MFFKNFLFILFKVNLHIIYFSVFLQKKLFFLNIKKNSLLLVGCSFHILYSKDYLCPIKSTLSLFPTPQFTSRFKSNQFLYFKVFKFPQSDSQSPLFIYKPSHLKSLFSPFLKQYLQCVIHEFCRFDFFHLRVIFVKGILNYLDFLKLS